MKRYDVLIIDDGTIEGRINMLSVRHILELLNSLPLEYALKMHPNIDKRNNLYGDLFQNSVEFSRYIPIEFFFQFIKKCVIASMSVSLIIASKFENLKSISILECIKWYNQKYKDEIKFWLKTESNNKVLFPNNLNELKEVLI